MRVLSLYSGVGGLEIAAHEAGMTTVALCEADAWNRQLLALRFPGVPIYENDEHITADRLIADGLWPIDIVTGGPPCQPSSAAGKRLGAADPRWRWPQAIRIVRETRPRWFLYENPRGFLSVGAGWHFGAVVGELADLGYSVGWGLWGASAVGAPHRRERVFIIGRRRTVGVGQADTNGAECEARIGDGLGEGASAQPLACAGGPDVADAAGGLLPITRRGSEA